ncbi:hypothetical protein SAMN02746065_12236 [Desulfocicer vacuolatum DSM 3385]|uniref:Uncharacterized protein n=1 Tax=Desulfocicer vacuolatum DSM 3385 TaxID=1121400 RepID=A0A1W2DYC3_9BACT|nr:hypothetical protein SAMN02746065_12236 [Desulfocicer vacuolatum DSM 3385]
MQVFYKIFYKILVCTKKTPIFPLQARDDQEQNKRIIIIYYVRCDGRKYSANQGCISSFVVGRAGSEYTLPVAVYIQCNLSRAPPDGQ